MVFPLITENDKTLPLYVTGVGRQDPQQPIERKSGFPSYQIFLVTHGEGRFYSKNLSFEIKAGDVLFIPKNIFHGYYPTKKPFVTRWISFDGNKIEDLLRYLNLNDISTFTCSDFANFHFHHNKMLKFAENDDYCDIAILSSMFYRYLFEIVNSKININNTNQKLLNEIRSYIQQNYKNDISLDELSELVQISKFTLCKIFKKEYKITIFDYLINVRIQQAKYLLIENENMKIKEIANAVGFHESGYFIRVFKKNENVTPTEFRKTK